MLRSKQQEERRKEALDAEGANERAVAISLGGEDQQADAESDHGASEQVAPPSKTTRTVRGEANDPKDR